jgi:hypothetical protein
MTLPDSSSLYSVLWGAGRLSAADAARAPQAAISRGKKWSGVNTRLEMNARYVALGNDWNEA